MFIFSAVPSVIFYIIAHVTLIEFIYDRPQNKPHFTVARHLKNDKRPLHGVHRKELLFKFQISKQER